jgi:hypothetical protein
MNNQICNILWNIVGGIISGVIVYFIIGYREKQQWKKSKTEIVKLLDGALNRALTTVRLLAGIRPPRNNEQFIEYIEQEFGNDCKILSQKINNHFTPEAHKILLTNVQGLQEEIRYLLSIFLSFKKAENWYIENILDIHNRTQATFWVFAAFPEISDAEYQNDEKIKECKEYGTNSVVEFCKFILVLKCDEKIKNYIDW